ncbi:MAG: hypothetical protein AAF933_15940 [Pseudomonadota bacterium]
MRKLHAGLDVALKVTSICVVGENDATVLEAKALSELDAITRRSRLWMASLNGSA